MKNKDNFVSVKYFGNKLGVCHLKKPILRIYKRWGSSGNLQYAHGHFFYIGYIEDDIINEGETFQVFSLKDIDARDVFVLIPTSDIRHESNSLDIIVQIQKQSKDKTESYFIVSPFFRDFEDKSTYIIDYDKKRNWLILWRYDTNKKLLDIKTIKKEMLSPIPYKEGQFKNTNKAVLKVYVYKYKYNNDSNFKSYSYNYGMVFNPQHIPTKFIDNIPCEILVERNKTKIDRFILKPINDNNIFGRSLVAYITETLNNMSKKYKLKCKSFLSQFEIGDIFIINYDKKKDWLVFTKYDGVNNETNK